MIASFIAPLTAVAVVSTHTRARARTHTQAYDGGRNRSFGGPW